MGLWCRLFKRTLLVMNGQKLAQNDATGDWKTEKITKAKGTKPGIYNSVDADPLKDNIGEVIYIDKKGEALYQKNDSQFIKHDLSVFDKIPENASFINIKYAVISTRLSNSMKRH